MCQHINDYTMVAVTKGHYDIFQYFFIYYNSVSEHTVRSGQQWTYQHIFMKIVHNITASIS